MAKTSLTDPAAWSGVMARDRNAASHLACHRRANELCPSGCKRVHAISLRPWRESANVGLILAYGMHSAKLPKTPESVN